MKATIFSSSMASCLHRGGGYNCETAMRVFGTGLCREVFDSKGYLFLKKNELLNKLMTVHDTLGGP